MIKYLHYDGTDIRLEDGQSLEAWSRCIEAAAQGSGWVPVTDFHGVVHRVRVTPGVAIRLSEQPPPPAPIAF